ncbi:glycosyltransferase family 4 protein [Anthocerotibacter panamensis]|uniref:glycosyltransferase family 4 protein n=1 Tax=Anthocerotibacter panamensis TaxID=2857077 RepID=UPI001C4042EE|nr:glycosyltransferase family 1 protein [Anthocerotibacter panamensis]
MAISKLEIGLVSGWGVRIERRRNCCALISVHGDPAAEIGHEGAGGQNVYVRETGLALAKRGYQVDMFTRREHPDQPEIEHHALGCRTIRLTAGPACFIPRMELFAYLPEFVQQWRAFQARQRYNYQILHTHYWDSAWVGMQLQQQTGLPHVHTYHSLGAVKYQKTDVWCAQASTRLEVERQVLEQASCVVATSPQEEADLRHLVSQQGQIQVIPCGTNTKLFAPMERRVARERLGLAPTSRVVLYVGRFDPRKGIETLVRACAILPDRENFQLILVGGSLAGAVDDQEYHRIQRLVHELGLDSVTTFTGSQPQSKLVHYYAAADVCVVPSYYEPFGLVTVEAMACGTPVIASDVGGLKFTVQSGITGQRVPPRDPAALAQALWSVFAQPQQWRDFGRSARQRVAKHFSWPGVARQLDQLYQSLQPSVWGA